MSWLAWLEIFLWYPCNQKCTFCFQKDLRFDENKFLDYSEVIWIIDKWFSKGKRTIIFSWWEATMDKNLLTYIKYCNEKGFIDIRVHTNGLHFSKYENLLEYYNSGMNGVILSIHWYWKVHDLLVWVNWAFDKIKLTLLNLTKLKKEDRGFVFDTNTVLTKLNFNSLHLLFKFFSYFPITRSQIVQLYSLYLFDIKEKKSLYVSYDDFYKFIPEIISNNKNVTFENFPFCKFNQKYWDFIIKRQKYDNDAYWNMGEWFEESDCTFLDNCSSCSYKDDCVWIPKDYLKVYPWEKFII